MRDSGFCVGIFEVDRRRGAGQNKNRIEEPTDKRRAEIIEEDEEEEEEA